MLLANAFLVSTDLEVPSHIVTQSNKAFVVTPAQRRDLDILHLFNNDKRAYVAPYSIQNFSEIGLKEYGVYPG